jgi:hypothetical protein
MVRRICYPLFLSTWRRLEYDADARMQSAGVAPQHAKRVTFVAQRLKPADLLLRGLEELSEVLRRKSGLLSESADLQHYIPRIPGALEARGKRSILQLLFRGNGRNWSSSSFHSFPG